MAAFFQAIKHHEVKTWATLQQQKMSRWAKKQAPVAVRVAQAVTEQALDMGGTVVAIAVVLTRAAAKAAFELGRNVGAIVQKKGGTAAATPSVDPVILDPALQDVIALLGEDDRFEGKVFNFQQTKTGVDVHLKNGIPIYTDGQLNSDVDRRFSDRLSRIPEHVAKVKADVSKELTAQDYQRQLIEV